MHIVFYGTGGVGGNYGGFLARSGVDVTFIARGEHLRQIKKEGLKIESPKGDFVIKPASATDDPSTVKKADVVFVATKSWQLDEAVKGIASMITPTTIVVPLLNSIEAIGVLTKAFGADHVLGGICYTVSYIVRPGVIHASGDRMIVGELDHTETPRARALVDQIDKAEGITCTLSTNIEFDIWKKFSWISSAGAIGSITRSPIGIWRELPQSFELFKALLREAFAVAKAQGVVLDESEFAQILTFISGRPPSFKASMQRDYMGGTRSELEYQLGAVVRAAKAAAVPVPLSDAVYGALLPLELKAQGKLTFPE